MQTRFTERFGLDSPLMSAPMALHSGGRLAGAVSAAGALGSFGGIHMRFGPEWVGEQIAEIRARTDRPFAVGFITPFLPAFAGPYLEAALEAPPSAVFFSFGDASPWMARVRAAGAAVICQVQTFDEAARAAQAGADVLVAQGTEAGGHTGHMGLLPLLVGVLERHPALPVLAAGGIADGRALAAVLAAGADGACLGTAFLATPEAVEVHDAHKQCIVASDGGDTIHTRAYDIRSGLPWPETIGARVRRNRFTERWSGREAELAERREEFADPSDANPFAAPPDLDEDPVLYGQAAGRVTAVRPAAEVVRRVCEEAEAILRERAAALL